MGGVSGGNRSANGTPIAIIRGTGSLHSMPVIPSHCKVDYVLQNYSREQ